MTIRKDVKTLVEGYMKYTVRDVKYQKTPEVPGMTLSKSNLEEPYNIDKYRSFVGQLIWYTNKVGTDVAHADKELAVHTSHPGIKHWKSLGHLIGYLKVK